MGGRRKRGLADLIGEVGTAPQEHEGEDEDRGSTATEAAPETREEARVGWPRGGGGTTAQERSLDEATMPTAPPRVPKYLALERKEARLRGDQVDSLALLARRINRQKPSRGGERITENTLIRVAVDWLLSQEAHVGGSTEDEIRRSLSVWYEAP